MMAENTKINLCLALIILGGIAFVILFTVIITKQTKADLRILHPEWSQEKIDAASRLQHVGIPN